MKFLLVALLGITTAFAQSEPVTRIKGDNDASFKIAPNLKVPYKQATKINSTTARIEIGNGNMLPDPSFESGVLPPTGTPASVGDIQFNCNAYGTNAIVTSSISNDGTKAFKMTFGQGSGAFEGVCSFNTVLPSNLAGTPIEWSFEGSLKNDVRICISSFQISPSLTQPETCYEFNEVGGINKRYVIPYTPLYNRLALTFKRINNTDISTVREAELDFYYMGKPKSDEAIVAKFDNTTGWTDLGATSWSGTTTNPTKGTMSRDKVWGKRNGTNLDLRIEMSNSTAGSIGSGVYTLNLPRTFEGQSINVDSSKVLVEAVPTTTTITNSIAGGKVGDGQLSFADGASLIFTVQAITGNKVAFKGVAANSGAANPYWFSSALAMFSYAPGKLVANISVPIEEWSSQTNAAIVACKEGPLKCNNTFTASVTAAGIVTYPTGQVPWINGNCTLASSIMTCNYVSDLVLQNKMDCSVVIVEGSASGWNYRSTSTNTKADYEIFQTSEGATTFRSHTLNCKKVGVDIYNPNATVTPMSDMNDVKSTEWVVGWSHIDSKPIYQRCRKVASDISTDATTIVSWGTGLNPIAPNFGNSSNEFVVSNGSTNAGYYAALYNKTTGNLRIVLSGGYIMRAGSYFCMKYVK